ncbi:MAG: aminotransferase class IV [Nodosilinea sp.]
MVYWFDGHIHAGTHLAVAWDDPALMYGATVFTTLRVYNNDLDHPLTAWVAHQERLARTLENFGWRAPPWQRLRQGADQLKGRFPILRLTCWPDGRELITGRSLPSDLPQIQHQGILAWVARDHHYQRSLPGYKTGNYLSNWLAIQAARSQQAREAILVDPQGHWLETSTGNLWGWGQERWHTPPLAANLLPGVSRQHLIYHLQRQGLEVSQKPWTRALMGQFTALAYSNCAVQVVPIHTVLEDGGKLEFDPQHSSLQLLRSAFEDY